MYLASLQPLATPQAYICGDVEIDPSAVIAPGVLIQADTGSSIRIGPGVCVGMGTIVHSSGGEITIESGANIGAGVLLAGALRIGKGSCIGATSTIYQTDIPPGKMIGPGSLVMPPAEQNQTPPTEVPSSETHIKPEFAQQVQSQDPSASYGQAQLNRLMVKIFPHRQSSA